jgi:hypothetical protein
MLMTMPHSSKNYGVEDRRRCMRVGYSTSQPPMTRLPESVESMFWDLSDSTIRLREGFDKQLIEKVREENNTRSLTESSALFIVCWVGSPPSLSRVPMSDKKTWEKRHDDTYYHMLSQFIFTFRSTNS